MAEVFMLIRSLLILLLVAAAAAPAGAATLEAQTAEKLQQIRAIRPGQGDQADDAYNKELDAAWEFFNANKQQVLPILRRLLKAEIEGHEPNNLVLLDIGWYLHESELPDGKTLGREALFHLDPRAPIVDWNRKEFFELVHAAAEDHDPRVLALIDHEFLRSDKKIVIPEHSLELDGTLVCVFLYGAYGSEAESAVRAKLSDRSTANRAIEILIWLGSPESLPAVGAAQSAAPNYETFSRVASYMMQAAGPAGRDFMLKLDSAVLDAQSREYLSKTRSAIQATTFESIRKSSESLPGDKRLTDDEVKSRLNAMIGNFGKIDRTSPLAILDSGLPGNFLIAQLTEARHRSLYRLSDEALSDLQVTNALINGLRYRNH
jgi:hypothetical protein